MPMSTAVPPSPLAVRGLSVAFSGLQVLDDVTFELPGGVSAVIGPNGAGKTTLLNCVNGLVRYSGEVLLGGNPLGTASAPRRCRRGIARTFQTPILLDELTVTENVLLGGHGRRSWRRGGEAAAHGEAADLLECFGLAHRRHTLAGDLPHGDRRRVETARALMGRPQVLLLDEPAAGLDDHEAFALIRTAAGLTRSCILVEHNMHLVMTAAAHVVVLASGHVLATGTPDAVQRDPQVIEAYLGDGVL